MMIRRGWMDTRYKSIMVAVEMLLGVLEEDGHLRSIFPYLTDDYHFSTVRKGYTGIGLWKLYW